MKLFTNCVCEQPHKPQDLAIDAKLQTISSYLTTLACKARD